MKKTASGYSLPEELNQSDIIDLRGLEAPEPMVQILQACTQLGSNDRYLAQLPHVPEPLFPHLESRGMAWQVFEQADGSALVAIRRNL
jgi:hypothetical protein